MKSSKREARILSVDGGGLKALVPAVILGYIESVTGKPIHRCFHMMTSCSASSLLTLALASRTDGSRPLTAHELTDLLLVDTKSLYKKSHLVAFKSLFGKGHPRAAYTRVNRLASRVFKNLLLSDCLIDVQIPVWDAETGMVLNLSSWEANPEYISDLNRSRSSNFKLRSLYAATLAPPGVLPLTPTWDGKRKPRLIADSSFVSSDPMDSGIGVARDLYNMAEQFSVLSLGVGVESRTVDLEQSLSFDASDWLRLHLDAGSGGSDLIKHQQWGCADDISSIVRVDPVIQTSGARSRKSMAWQNVGTHEIDAMIDAAKRTIQEADHNGLADFCAYLTENPLAERSGLVNQKSDRKSENA